MLSTFGFQSLFFITIIVFNSLHVSFFMPCAYCKGGHVSESCSWYAKARIFFKHRDIGANFSGGSPAPFVGHFGYPFVNVGFLVPPGIVDSSNYDNPRGWSSSGAGISDIVEFRGSLVNSHITSSVKNFDNRVVEFAQISAMSSKPVFSSVELEKRPLFRVFFDENHSPMGPSGVVKKVVQEDNPKIPLIVEKSVGDFDLRAADAVSMLYEKGVDENKISQLLSVGTLGIGRNRRIVPTKWSITATDDVIGKFIHKSVILFPEISSYEFFSASFHGNYYYIFLYPGSWEFELFEYSLSNGGLAVDREGFLGRSSYADNCVGGYYAVRLAVLDYLNGIKRQAGVFVLRIITGEYTVPLGVWVTREASRKALSSKPVIFADREKMKLFSVNSIRSKHFCDVERFFKQSSIHNKKESQKKIWEY